MAPHDPVHDLVIEARAGSVRVGWHALGGPCELLLEGDDVASARRLGAIAAEESWRIERKFSRYRDDGVLHAIHAADGMPVTVDDETAALLDYGAECHAISQGRFDLTSGVLRRVWRFDGSDAVPTEDAVHACLAHVGWAHVRWERPVLVLPRGMELDLGGLGKEVAVDRAVALVAAHTTTPFLMNFGGDLATPGPRADGTPWQVGLDDPEHTGARATHVIALTRGALATSGDARRHVRHQGRRLGHILDARTGWPVVDAPSSVTVLADTCLMAGTLATLAVLQGPGAVAFLEGEGVVHHVVPASTPPAA